MFEKISKKINKRQEPQANSQQDARTLETIKLLAKQILEIREIIDEQSGTIKALRKEVQVLKAKQHETDGNFQLSHIDQRDVAKQLRILKANMNGNKIAAQMSSSIKEEPVKAATEVRATDYFPNYQSSQVIQNAQTLEMIDMAMPHEIAEEEISSRKAEDVAKQFIFGRMPKLLKLD